MTALYHTNARVSSVPYIFHEPHRKLRDNLYVPTHRQVTWNLGEKWIQRHGELSFMTTGEISQLKKKKKNYGEEKLLGNCFQISPSKCPLAVKNPLCSCLDSQESSSQLHFLYHTLASQCVITRWIFPQSCYKLLM